MVSTTTLPGNGHRRSLLAPDDARRYREDARRRAESVKSKSGVVGQAERWIGDNPAVAVGAAAAIGILLGWWLKR